jgi:hypothetical protein
MFEKLKGVEKRFSEIEKRLGDPEIQFTENSKGFFRVLKKVPNCCRIPILK